MTIPQIDWFTSLTASTKQSKISQDTSQTIKILTPDLYMLMMYHQDCITIKKPAAPITPPIETNFNYILPKKSDIKKLTTPIDTIYQNRLQLHPTKKDTVELLSTAL